MKRIFSILTVGTSFVAAAFGQTAPKTPPTFTKDVAPIVQQHCESCHRPGEGTPFSLVTYQDVQTKALMIKDVIQEGIMPPWFADPSVGHFSNDRSLTKAQIDTIVAWVNAGTPRGDPKDMPAPLNFVEGWSIPKPDVIFQIPRPFPIPATGIMQYQYVIVPTGFTTDKWVQMAEVRPTNRAVVHHIVAYVRAPGSTYFKGEKKEVFFEQPPVKATNKKVDTSALPSDFLVGYAPGQPAEIWKPGEAKLIKAGSDIVFELHYMPNGTATEDRAKLGLVFAKEPPEERVMTLAATNGTFKIPPGDPNYGANASFDVLQNVTLLGLHPHMHERGKNMTYWVVYPDGKKVEILNVPHYNWRWQLWYNLEKPISLPKGSKIECTAHWDNSANNPQNPDPTKTITWGDQSFDEMMVCFFDLAFPANMPVRDLFPLPKVETASVAK
ncbi:MAG TPA: thiol-disulfide isomerase [Acidobacteriaceae bacterium]|jgi:hypothetical protein|nr:thiol-disulfide isomerase [Acidobacteriaceae bacterium]